MNKANLAAFTLFLLMVAQALANGAVGNIQIVPENPTSCDIVVITLSGQWGSSCIPNASAISVVGNDIYFDVIWDYPPDIICAAVITPWELTRSVGPLSPATYTVYARLVGHPPIPEEYTLMAEFTVTAESCVPTVYYVDAADGNDLNDGLTPETAFATIQKGIDTAKSSDTVLVADGTYTGNGNRDIDFLGKAITLRSKNGPNNCIIDCNGTEENRTRGFYFHSGEDANSIIDGFTITGGTGAFAFEAGGIEVYWGAGICCDGSSPTIVRNVIVGNHGPVQMDGDTPVVVSFGGGIVAMAGEPTITRNIIKDNSAYLGAAVAVISGDAKIVSNLIYENFAWFGGGAAPMFGGQLLANTIVENSGLLGGGVCLLSDDVIGTGLVSGNIICDSTKGGGLYADANSLDAVWYNNLHNNTPADYVDTPNLTGIGGNISADPCFINAAVRDFTLDAASPCINAGDPCYVPEPNETDFGGRPRVNEGRIDMGAYEYYYNTPPVAVAGPNQIAYAFIDGYADVNLDGSGSYDNDNDVLDYYWSWTIDSNVYEASGIAPIIELPIGKHEIELVVDDGIDLSEPNHCTVTVIAPLQAWLFCIPRTLYSKTCYPGKLSALISMPLGIHKADINLTEPLIFYPGQIKSQCQFAFEFSWHWKPRTYVWASFDKSACIEHLAPGFNRVNVVGKLTTDRYYDAAGYLRLVPWKWHHWPHFFRRGR